MMLDDSNDTTLVGEDTRHAGTTTTTGGGSSNNNNNNNDETTTTVIATNGCNQRKKRSFTYTIDEQRKKNSTSSTTLVAAKLIQQGSNWCKNNHYYYYNNSNNNQRSSNRRGSSSSSSSSKIGTTINNTIMTCFIIGMVLLVLSATTFYNSNQSNTTLQQQQQQQQQEKHQQPIQKQTTPAGVTTTPSFTKTTTVVDRSTVDTKTETSTTTSTNSGQGQQPQEEDDEEEKKTTTTIPDTADAVSNSNDKDNNNKSERKSTNLRSTSTSTSSSSSSSKKSSADENNGGDGPNKDSKDNNRNDTPHNSEDNNNSKDAPDSSSDNNNNSNKSSKDAAAAPAATTAIHHDDNNDNNDNSSQRKSENNDDDVNIVLISDRISGIIPVIASVLKHSSKPVHAWVIGNVTMNEQIRQHFGQRLASFVGLTIDDVRTDIMEHYHNNKTSHKDDHNNDNGLSSSSPTWMWDEWHSSMGDATTNNNNNNKNWYNNNTIHPGMWDYRIKHSMIMNQIFFYVPHLSSLHHLRYVYIIEDDVLIQKDLAVLLPNDKDDKDDNKNDDDEKNNKNDFFLASCNGWVWSDTCQQFVYHSTVDTIWNMPALYYGTNYTPTTSSSSSSSTGSPICTTMEQSSCVPNNYRSFVHDIVQKVTTRFDNNDETTMMTDESTTMTTRQLSKITNQVGWSFGFTLLLLQNWRTGKATERYEMVMKENYIHHVYPETSLSFGLGIPYLAFAGNVGCWNEPEDQHASKTTMTNNKNSIVKVRDGFGFIDWSRMKETFRSEIVFDTADVVHYSGLQKPWEDYFRKEPAIVQPWYELMKEEHLSTPKQFIDKYSKASTTTEDSAAVKDQQQQQQPPPQLFIVLSGSRSGGYWLMSTLDNDPNICATGETMNGESGYPDEVLYPDDMNWYPTCSIKRSCSYSYVRKKVLELSSTTTTTDRCDPSYDSSTDDDKDNLQRLCAFKSKLNGNYSIARITEIWVDAFVDEDPELLRCRCHRGVKAKGVKLLSDWVHYEGYPDTEVGPALVPLNHTKLLPPDKTTKIIRIKRKNLWARYKSMQIAKMTDSFWHVRSANEKKQQVAVLSEKVKDHHGGITIDLNDLKQNMKYMSVSDQAGDEWAQQVTLPENILSLDYDECKSDTVRCFQSIYQFLGIDNVGTTIHKQHPQEGMTVVGDHDSKKIYDINQNLDFIRNREPVLELLVDNNWHHYVLDDTANR